MEPVYIVMAIIAWLTVGATAGWIFWRCEFGVPEAATIFLLPAFAVLGPVWLVVLWRQKRYGR